MSDLKNCPFCGGKAEWANGLKGDNTPWRYIACEVCEATAPYPGDDPAAWNRRALQAVGPEPAVAVKWEQLSEIINAAVKVAIRTCSDFHIDADKLREFAGSALVATPPAEPVVEGLDVYYDRQIEWSRETFGPGGRTLGILDHIRKELHEIAADPQDLSEWVDVIILAMDGFWRHGGSASDLMPCLVAKQKKNMGRTWPDWRTMSEDRAIEHDRSDETALANNPAVKDDETVVEALRNWTGWRSIDTAPEDCRVLLATAGNWVGEAIMLRDEETGEQVWTWVDTGKPSLHSCYGWMPLPEHLLAPVLSDLRPDGFDGPTGAE